MNLVDYTKTNMHHAYEAVKACARELGINASGSELVGLAPLEAFLHSGRFYSAPNNSRVQEELVERAVRALGLNDTNPFVKEERILEYALNKCMVE